MFGQSMTFMATLSGVATYVSPTLAARTYTVSATNRGDSNFNGSAASTINQVVNEANTTTIVVSSLNPAPVTRLITFTYEENRVRIAALDSTARSEASFS